MTLRGDVLPRSVLSLCSTMKIVVLALIASAAFGAQTERSIEHLPPCRASNVSAPKSWQVIESPHAHVRFRIPAGMQEIRDPKAFCIHGCEQWSRGTFKISVSHGIWGPSSFDDEAWATACVDKRGPLRVVQMPSKNGRNHVVVMWPVNDTSTQSTDDIILNVQWSDSADDADAAKVIASVR
jgi:hypothetical protein